jgi:heme a synthase
MQDVAQVNFAPALRLAALVLLLVLLPLAVVWRRSRGGDRSAKLAALTAVTLFLTFDLVVFGAFTRLTDSGLGCPDWPGCYGHASPIGASADIHAAQQAAPGGPVTFPKAWIEMIHRYLAMIVGLLCLFIAAASWLERARLPHSPWWPTLTLVWVVVQGLFGKYTVTWKLYPLVVTLHLLGGVLLLSLLALQHHAFRARREAAAGAPAAWLPGLVLTLVVVQIALGGWVSTNYAVLACNDVPRCNGAWWPEMDFARGFTLLRELGQAGDGSGLPFPALVAIHMAHRLFALVVIVAVALFCLRMARRHGGFAPRLVQALALLTALQVATGLSNIVLGWPLLAALAHSAGAAGMTLVLTFLLARTVDAQRPAPRRSVVAATA